MKRPDIDDLIDQGAVHQIAEYARHLEDELAIARGSASSCASSATARLAESKRDRARADATEAENAKLRRAVEAARLFRKADTGGGFNDRVECGKVLDAVLAAVEAGR